MLPSIAARVGPVTDSLRLTSLSFGDSRICLASLMGFICKDLLLFSSVSVYSRLEPSALMKGRRQKEADDNGQLCQHGVSPLL